MHDLVLTGGRLLDPVNNIEGPADLAIRDGRVSEITVVDVRAGRAVWSFARGNAVLADGQVTGRGGMLMVTRRGEGFRRAQGVAHESIHDEGWA